MSTSKVIWDARGLTKCTGGLLIDVDTVYGPESTKTESSFGRYLDFVVSCLCTRKVLKDKGV